MTEKEALALLKPTLSNYRKFTGYTNDNKVREKLKKLFGESSARPSIVDFTKALKKDLEDVAAGRVKQVAEGELDRNQMAARKDAAHAEKLEMENAVRRGELVEAEEVKKKWSDIASNIRASLMSLPSRVAKELSALGDPREIQIKLDEEVRNTLESLGNDHR